MSTLIVAQNGLTPQFIKLEKILTTIGNSLDFDHFIETIPGMGITITKEEKGVKFTAIDCPKKNLKGPWNKNLDNNDLLWIGDVSLFYINQELEINNKNDKDTWNLNRLPKNPTTNSYPTELLNFLLDGIGIQEGALFYRKDKMLHSLAAKGLNVRNQAEALLLQYVDSSDQNIIHVNFDTHTMLFNAGLSPYNFIIVKSEISEDMDAVLYLPWPSDNDKINVNILETIIHLCAQSISLHVFHKFNRSLENESSKFTKGTFFWGNNHKMLRLKGLTDRLAPTDLSLMIHGETGTGKDVLANYISSISDKKMVAINCAAIPKELAESVLFGHTKGSFTGAVKDSLGKITEADGGILFLDEIAELDLETQSKLLRVLQDGIVTPIGGHPVKVNVRVISATHKDLHKMISQGLFREDLYFRLNEATLNLPPLRERQEDVATLAKVFLDEVCKDNTIEEKVFSTRSIDFLKAYEWKGNIRELLSTMRRMAILCETQVVEVFDIESNLQNYSKSQSKNEFPLNLNEAKDILIKNQVQKALKQSGGNKTHAAKLLGITSRTLFRMIADHDIKDIGNDINVTALNITNRNHMPKIGTSPAL